MQCSSVNFNDLDRVVFRLDAEYYHPAHLQLANRIKSLARTSSLRGVGAFFDCSAFYPSIVPHYNYERKGIPFVRVNEVQNGLVQLTDGTVFLPDSILDEHKPTIAQCLPGDLVIAKGGNSLAKVALLTDDYPRYSICRDVMVLRVQSLNINPYYLWMLLHSSVGQRLMLRTASQTGQPHLTVEALYELLIPVFSSDFQGIFEKLYRSAVSADNTASCVYQQAKDTLMSALGLANWQPRQKLSFIANYRETEAAERVDAEYFQPKYAELVNAIRQYPGGCDRLGNLAVVRKQNFLPKAEQTYDYIELADIAGNGEITGCTSDEGVNLPSRARRKVNAGDVLVSSIEGSSTRIAIVSPEYHHALCSTGFYVLTPAALNAETLLVLLKSPVGQEQLKQGCRGTILTAINADDFESIVLPKVAPALQATIKEKISESFRLRHKAKHLLDAARRAVELAIEQDEPTARKWLDAQMQNTGQL